MTILTGADGQLKYGDAIIGKASNFSLAIARDAIDVTPLGTYDREFTNGLRATTGSARLFYAPDDATAVSFLNTVLENKNDVPVTFVMDKTNGSGFVAGGFLTSVGTSVASGEAQTCEIAFTISGLISGSF